MFGYSYQRGSNDSILKTHVRVGLKHQPMSVQRLSISPTLNPLSSWNITVQVGKGNGRSFHNFRIRLLLRMSFHALKSFMPHHKLQESWLILCDQCIGKVLPSFPPSALPSSSLLSLLPTIADVPISNICSLCSLTFFFRKAKKEMTLGETVGEEGGRGEIE